MTAASLASATENAVVTRVRRLLADVEPSSRRGGPVVIGIRTRGVPEWAGDEVVTIDNRRTRFVACPSVLAMLDALAETRAEDDALVVLTDRDPGELGDAVMARLYREKLYDVSKYTLLHDLLQTKQLDPRIRASDQAWLVDALVGLAQGVGLPAAHGTVLSRELAVAHVLRARLGVEPDTLDLVGLIGALDDAPTRTLWRSLPEDERHGLTERLVEMLGRPAEVVTRLARSRDDLLAELLVADVLTAAPATDPVAAERYGGFRHSRFGSYEPARADVRTAAQHAVRFALDNDSERVRHQIRRADILLAELNGVGFAQHSRVLPSGFTQRLQRAAQSSDGADLAALREHALAEQEATHVRRVEAAVRLRRWLDATPEARLAGIDDALRRHARELAWVDRELTQVRQGSADDSVAAALADVADRAGRRRDEFDRAFARLLPDAAHAVPDDVVGVESLLPEVVTPLVRRHRVLLVVVDGMSGAVAAEIVDSVVQDGRGGWTEVVRAPDGGRDAVLAAFPTETSYCRTSLLAGSLRSGTQADEPQAFTKAPFWPPNTRAVLVHKSGVGGTAGSDLGPELDEALSAERERQVVAVVLNAVDESLPTSRQSHDPAWTYRDVPGLPQLLERAATGRWIVVLTSDHGHVLEHGSERRPDDTGGSRWRQPESPSRPGEVALSGPRVLAPGGSAVLAASERLRYGRRAHGYHGGATLAEVAIPLVVLVPPGAESERAGGEILDGWAVQTMGPPDWWTGRPTTATPLAPAAPERPRNRRKPTPPPAEPDLFTPDHGDGRSRGDRLIASETFQVTHRGQPRNRVPAPEVFAAVVDALIAAGGRLPVAAVLQAAGTPGRNPRGVVTALARVLNLDAYPVITLADGDRTVVLDQHLLDEQFPPEDG
ncbi:BREX-2 system phosphatase PglZ [Gandjariella thermophila]|uniref:Uncharacterized protein n=1 Tax=Gandjariella thermophila TaxID=1931992 RepID=A0A4D4JEG2_9PSEU|nr:BREX-2 system phosphatase PglZ [Gandjariella thermophila]GDY33048.1 hypothetical protein GTS_46810 [Gandjariella thermophila]